MAQVANITVADATTINIQPYEKTMIQAIEKVIRESDMGLNPATSGDLIRIPMPTLTEERRKDLMSWGNSADSIYKKFNSPNHIEYFNIYDYDTSSILLIIIGLLIMIFFPLFIN